jgi:hypothetical protein
MTARLSTVVACLIASTAIASEIAPGMIRDAQSATTIIRTPFGGGSGFLVRLDGAAYIVTNQHVLQGTQARDVKITFADGSPAMPTSAEIATGNIDLVRLRFETKRHPLDCAKSLPTAGSSVVAIGNSLDSGVVTVNPGEIAGVGADDIEVSCEIVPGNSGGPLIDEAGHVLGVATRIEYADKERATKDTRYENDRRFCTRLHDGMRWIPVRNWQAYASAGATIEAADILCRQVRTAANAVIGGDDLSHISLSNASVAAAVASYQQLSARLDKMDGQLVTEQQLQRNNNILGSSYCITFQKLRDACAPNVRVLESLRIPPEWAWLESKRRDTLDIVTGLYEDLDAESHRRPKFLKFTGK